MIYKRKIRIIDTTLRDGSHSVSHQFNSEDILRVATGLERAGIDTLEVAHGDGLGGSSIQYGFSRVSDQEALQKAKGVTFDTRLAVFIIPGIGVKEDLKMAYDEGARVARIATHVTGADISSWYLGLAKEIGMEAIGFLMLSHIEPPTKILEQARLMESYGADVVYVVDSAGAMVPDDVRRRVGLLKEKLSLEVGFHGHNNLGLAMGNTLAAIEEGAGVVDGCLAGLGAGAGNTPTEVLVAVLDKMGYETGVDLYKVMDTAEDVVRPMMRHPQVIDKAVLSLGYAGVYSSFLLHVRRAAEKYRLEPRDILIELGRRRAVGGQEDMIIDVAIDLSGVKA